MTTEPIQTEKIIVRLAQNDNEIEQAQRLRYAVFYEEYGAKASPEISASKLDIDDYDAFADHLVVVDQSEVPDKIIGTYRLVRQSCAEKFGRFYSSAEYDLAPLLQSDAALLELGRSCVLPAYRTKPVMQLLWQGIADFVADYKVDLMFGCASLHTTDIDSIAEPLSYLYHHHLAPEDIRVRALEEQFVDMNIISKDALNPRSAFKNLPPLIKGYLRLGATIGDGAVIDQQFNTTDVLIIVQTHLVTKRYRNHYERKIRKNMHIESAMKDSAEHSQESS